MLGIASCPGAVFSATLHFVSSFSFCLFSSTRIPFFFPCPHSSCPVPVCSVTRPSEPGAVIRLSSLQSIKARVLAASPVATGCVIQSFQTVLEIRTRGRLMRRGSCADPRPLELLSRRNARERAVPFPPTTRRPCSGASLRGQRESLLTCSSQLLANATILASLPLLLPLSLRLTSTGRQGCFCPCLEDAAARLHDLSPAFGAVRTRLSRGRTFASGRQMLSKSNKSLICD